MKATDCYLCGDAEVGHGRDRCEVIDRRHHVRCFCPGFVAGTPGRTAPRWTNKYGIDEAFARAVVYDIFRSRGDADFTVSELIRPPQINWLETQHADEITEDVADRAFALFGQLAHHVLQGQQVPGAFQEERVSCEVLGSTISGQADIYQDGWIRDFKTTSAWAYVYRDRTDWEYQLNFYAYIWRQHGFPVTNLRASGLLRDWMISKSKASPDDYPPRPFGYMDLPVWPERKCRRRIEQAVKEAQAARAGNFRPCTDEERFKAPDKFRVLVAGQKRAVAIFGKGQKRGGRYTEADALVEELTRKGRTAHIQIEHGENKRCMDYCVVADWCPQWAKLKEAG